MVFNTTFNNISVISWQSVLLVEENEYPEKTTEYISPWTGFELTTLVVIGIACTGNCKSNYHMIMTTMAPPGKLTAQIEPVQVHLIIQTDFSIKKNNKKNHIWIPPLIGTDTNVIVSMSILTSVHLFHSSMGKGYRQYIYFFMLTAFCCNSLWLIWLLINTSYIPIYTGRYIQSQTDFYCIILWWKFTL